MQPGNKGTKRNTRWRKNH